MFLSPQTCGWHYLVAKPSRWLVPDCFRTRAVIEINPDVLDIADELDQERQYGKIRGPLHGIPCLVKDVSLCPALASLCLKGK